MMSRNPRRFSALVALLALLFVQLSLAAHACAIKAGVESFAAVAMEVDPADQDPGLSDGALCEAHCLATASLPTPDATVLTSATGATPVVHARAVSFVVPPRGTSRIVLASPATATPVAARNCRLLL